MAYSIMLDAGHGGQDPGAVYKGRQEKDDNLKLALAVGKILENNGINVLYTRTTDVYQTPFEKAQLANQAKVDYFISFHRNSSSGEDKYTGVEVLVYDKSGIKYQMAENILGALGEIGFREIGVKERPRMNLLKPLAERNSRNGWNGLWTALCFGFIWLRRSSQWRSPRDRTVFLNGVHRCFWSFRMNWSGICT